MEKDIDNCQKQGNYRNNNNHRNKCGPHLLFCWKDNFSQLIFRFFIIFFYLHYKNLDTKSIMAGQEGLEPSTLGFGDRCSTN